MERITTHVSNVMFSIIFETNLSC